MHSLTQYKMTTRQGSTLKLFCTIDLPFSIKLIYPNSLRIVLRLTLLCVFLSYLLYPVHIYKGHCSTLYITSHSRTTMMQILRIVIFVAIGCLKLQCIDCTEGNKLLLDFIIFDIHFICITKSKPRTLWTKNVCLIDYFYFPVLKKKSFSVIRFV